MIEVSITEIALFCWAVIATGYAFKYKQQEISAKFFIKALLEDKDLRDNIVADFKQHMEKQT